MPATRAPGGSSGRWAPVVAVHEGGYHLPTLGSLTVAFLTALAGA